MYQKLHNECTTYVMSSRFLFLEDAKITKCHCIKKKKVNISWFSNFLDNHLLLFKMTGSFLLSEMQSLACFCVIYPTYLLSLLSWWHLLKMCPKLYLVKWIANSQIKLCRILTINFAYCGTAFRISKKRIKYHDYKETLSCLLPRLELANLDLSFALIFFTVLGNLSDFAIWCVPPPPIIA